MSSFVWKFQVMDTLKAADQWGYVTENTDTIDLTRVRNNKSKCILLHFAVSRAEINAHGEGL